jgi:hypothetical protein
MSAENRIKIPKVSDRVLFDCFKEIAQQHGITNISVTALGFANIGDIQVDSEPAGALKLLLDSDSAIIERCTLIIQGFSLMFFRGGNYQPQEKSGIFDEVIITEGNQKNISDESRISIISFLIKRLKAFDPNRVIVSGVLPEQAHLEAMHTSTLERLEHLNESLIQKSDQFRQRLEEEHHKKVKDLEEETRQKQTKLEEQFSKKEEKISELKNELEKKLKEIDDRDNRHARRSLRKALQAEIANRQTKFSLTPSTIKLRLPIHALCCALITIFSYGSFYYTQQYYVVTLQKELSVYQSSLILLKPFGLTIAAVGMAIFYLRWMNHWFEQHSQAEFHLKQFQLDVDRASWVVETALEWKSSLGSVIPTILLESISKNLFRPETKSPETPLHPGDQLASALLGSASKVRMQAGNAELEFTGKSLKKEMQDQK